MIFLHPVHNYAVVAYDPLALGLIGASTVCAAELLPGRCVTLKLLFNCHLCARYCLAAKFLLHRKSVPQNAVGKQTVGFLGSFPSYSGGPYGWILWKGVSGDRFHSF